MCILEPSDYSPYLTHATTVAYSRAQEGTAATLHQLVDEGDFRLITPISAAAMAKILKGAHQTRELSASQRRLLPPMT